MPELKVDIYLAGLVAVMEIIKTMRDRDNLNPDLTSVKQFGSDLFKRRT